MSQKAILDFLKESPKTWYSCRDIATYIQVNCSRITKELKQLRKYKEVHFKTAERGYTYYVYRHNGRRK